MVMHSFGPTTQRQRQADLSELKDSLVYIVWKMKKKKKSFKHTMLVQGQSMGPLSSVFPNVLLPLGLNRVGHFIDPLSFIYKRKFFKRNKEVCSYSFLAIFSVSLYL
jgi:hypothetical protein